MRKNRWIGVWSEVEFRVGWNDGSGGGAGVSEIRRRVSSRRGWNRGRSVRGRGRGRVFPLNCLEFRDTVPMFVFLLDPQNLTSNRRVEKLFPAPNPKVPVRNTNW